MKGLIKFVPMSRGQYAIVDEKNFEWAMGYTWGIHSQGYAITSRPGGRGRKLFMHRLIMVAQKHQRVDHKNRDVTDNRIENLRFCDHTENARNRNKAKNNTSGYKGVCRVGDKWRARIYPKSGQITIGTFKSKEEAARAYDEVARIIFGEFASPNSQDAQ